MIYARWDTPCVPELMPLLRPLPGGQAFENMEAWQFTSETGHVCTVPKGFITDLDSVPRIPFIYSMFKGRCRAAPTAHDFEYSTAGTLPRPEADALMLEIGRWETTKDRYILPMYYTVRVRGGSRFRRTGPRFVC